MDNQWIQSLLEWVTAHPGWAGVLVFAIAFIESLALVGILIPGIFILFGVGALIGVNTLEFVPIWIWASTGALFGDLVSFWLGFHYRDALLRMWPFRNFPAQIDQGRAFIHRHGRKSIFMGRFIGPLRPVVPVTAGMLAMNPGRFVNTDIIASIAWAPVYLIPGVLFGASLEVAAEYAGRLALLVAMLVAGLWLLAWTGRVTYELIAARSARWLRHAIRWSRQHALLGRITGPLLDPSRPEVLSVAMLGVGLFFTFWALITSLLLLPYSGNPLAIDQYTLDLALSLRNEVTDPLMVFLAQLGNWRTLLFAALALEILLLIQGRYKAAIHWLIAVSGGALLQLLLTRALSLMPQLMDTVRTTLPAPSATIVLATTCLGFFAVLVAPDLRRVHKRWPYVAAAACIALLAAARLYLGVDVLSTIMSGLLLGSCWTLVVGIAYRQRRGRPYGAALESSLFYIALMAMMAWSFSAEKTPGDPGYGIELEPQLITSRNWWLRDWSLLPGERSEFGTTGARKLNLQLAAELPEIRQLLDDNGWHLAEPAGWLWPLQSLNPGAGHSSLPIPARNYLGRSELLHMHSNRGNETLVESIHIWDSGFRLDRQSQPLYIAQLMNETLTRRLNLVSYWTAATASSAQYEHFADLLRKAGYEIEQREHWLLIRPGSQARRLARKDGDQ